MTGDVTGKHETTLTYMRNTVTGEVVTLRRGTLAGARQLDELHKANHPQIWHQPLWVQQFAPPTDPPPA